MRLIKNFLVSLLNKFTIYIVTLNFRDSIGTVALTRLGSAYGGWWVPTKYLLSAPNNKKVLVSAGLGHDVSFDIEMLAAGFTIFGLDPTEDAYIGASSTFENVSRATIINKGLWTSSGEQKFYKPRVVGHDSFSITNSQNQDEYLKFETISLRELVDTEIELEKFETKVLKMDIEGAEVPVLSDLIVQKLRFDFIAAEIDYLSVIPFKSFRKRFDAMIVVFGLLNKLKEEGYMLVKYEHYNFFWTLNNQKS